jgi:hypothetical protein
LLRYVKVKLCFVLRKVNMTTGLPFKSLNNWKENRNSECKSLLGKTISLKKRKKVLNKIRIAEGISNQKLSKFSKYY